MKTVIACCLSVVTFSSQAFAEVVWKGDFETGDLTQWSYLLNPTKDSRQNIRVVDSPVVSGTKAGEVTIHPDDLWQGNNHNRVELKHDAMNTAEGQTTYFSWYFRLPAHTQERNDIAYWETDETYNQTMAFWIEPNAGGTRLSFRTNHPSAMTHFNGPVTINEWHQIAMQILWSQDAATGSVSVWLDGMKVVDDVAARTKPDANAVFVQMGFHRNATAMPVETIYLDDAIEATTLDEILRPPAAGGSGGGGASGGGASGGGASGSGTGGGAGTSASAGTGGASVAGGAGGSSGTGTAGSPANGGMPGGTSSGGSSAGSGTVTSPPTDDGSCSCRAVGHRGGGWGFLAALALAAVAHKRRR